MLLMIASLIDLVMLYLSNSATMNKTKILIISVVLFLGILLLFVFWGESFPTQNQNPKALIGEVSQERLELTEKKQDCLDKLSYYETVQASLGKEQFCSERDDKIEALRLQHREILNKPYKQAVGLLTSR